MKIIMTRILNVILFTILTSPLFLSKAQTVTVDNYYNHETKKTVDGKLIDFHYLWSDTESTGFSIFGNAFKKNGARELAVLKEAPTAENLKNTAVFIIVDPDHVGDNPTPSYMTEKDAIAIAQWVKNGGVLLLMTNDKENADLAHFNLLATKFGFTFNTDLILFVKDDAHFDDGGLLTQGNPVFKTANQIFIKNACSINIKAKNVQPILKTKDGKAAMVTAKYGKGTVLALGDPWLYNEYVNGRLPAKFENDKAADDIAAWLLSKANKN
jgi:unsaturated rhamnogalacturonyl hydrolase